MKKLFFNAFVILFSTSVAFGQNIETGITHLEREQYERAKGIFKNIVKADPKNAATHFYMGQIYIALDKTDSAKFQFMKGITADEAEPLNYVGMGQITFEKSPTEGKRNFDKALELSKSKNSKVLGYIAQFYTTGKNKDLAQATTLLERAIKVDSKNPQPVLLLGDVLLEKNDAGGAVQKYDQALRLQPNLPEAYVKKGKIYVRAKNYSAGLTNYEEGLKVDANYPPLYREIGELYNKYGKYSQAIDAYQKYIALTDKSYDTDYRYGQFLYQAKEYKKAIELLTSLKNKEDNFYLYRMLAYSYTETEDYLNAQAYMTKFWDKVPEDKIIGRDYEYQGRIYLKQDNDSLALLNINKAIEINPENTEILAELANAYMSQKKYKEATKVYTDMCTKSTCKALDYLNYGKAAYMDKQFAVADTAFGSLTALSPTWANGYFWRAKVNHIQDPEIKKGIALPYYSKFIELASKEQEKYKADLFEAYKYVGAYQMQVKKNKVAADAAWSKIKELNPSFKEADEYMKAKY